MTIAPHELVLYAGALAILFLTPGPVWVALIARAVSGGFHAAWPLALGVVVGDMLWPLLAIVGVGFLIDIYADFLNVLRIGGAAILIWMGVKTIRKADKPLVADNSLSAAGIWGGFTAGLLVIIGNPKAVLFYMGILPGFFDIHTITAPDMLVISLISGLVPLSGNLFFALFAGRMRGFLASPEAVKRTNLASGTALVIVGIGIGLL